MRKLLFAAASMGLLVTATPSIAAPCKDAKGKFAKCGTPGAKPI